MKTSELTGPLLDYWVAKAEGYEVMRPSSKPRAGLLVMDGSLYFPGGGKPYSPSTEWADGGPIIDRERMNISFNEESSEQWCADAQERMDRPAIEDGPTLLIAAMRAYVAKKYGEEVPDEDLA